MYTKLAAWGILLEAGLMEYDDYIEKLHELFLANPESGFLLELEESTRSFKETCILLRRAWPDADWAVCARLILAPLEDCYRESSLPEFFDLARRTIRPLPDEEPFVFLRNAEDYFDYGAEQQARDEIERGLRQANPNGPPFDRFEPVQKKRRWFQWLRRSR